MPKSLMRKRLSLNDELDVEKARQMVEDHPSYSSDDEQAYEISQDRMDKIKKPKQYMRQGVKYDLYYQKSPTGLMRKRNRKAY